MVTLSALGPLLITVAGRPVTLRSPRQRAVLAMLVALAGRVVSVDQLLCAVWGDDPPDTAVGQIQTVVWRLRAVLGEATIATRPGGYQMMVEASEVDTGRFAGWAGQARGLAEQGRLEEAAEAYEGALRLWRDRPFADVEIPGDAAASGFQAAVTELIEQRVAVECGYFDVALALGRHLDVVPLLRPRVEEEPLREELCERLMLALYRCGRRTEALESYRHARAALVAELGLEPGPALQRLHTLILTADSTLDGVHPPPLNNPRPAQLPMDCPDFVARAELAAKLAALLSTPDSTAPVMVAVSGLAGSGKTTLAVHVGHLVREWFPDGQLFADLHGVHQPLDPAEVLARFLRALGEDPRAIPADIEERAAVFRARSAGRRILVVLDNAHGERQLRPLLPAGAGCAVLVTSRRRLAALFGAREVDLGVFEPEEALDLLRVTLGPQRVHAEREDFLAVARWCGYLPLAIRIAAARLAARPHWTTTSMVAQLSDEAARLHVLSAGDVAVRSSLALSVDALEADERTLFTRLGAVESPYLPAWVAAPLLDLPPAAAGEPMERLVEARLAEAQPTPGGEVRYRLHDLVRAYARELRPAAEVERYLGAWLTLADAAYRAMPGGFRRVARPCAPRWSRWSGEQVEAMVRDPTGWCEAHRAALCAAVRQAAAADLTTLAWNLAVTLSRFFELREHLEDWRLTHEAALAACRRAGDRQGEAFMLRGLGEMHLNQDRPEEALLRLGEALSIMEELGDRPGQAAALRAAGSAHRWLGREQAALDVLHKALALGEAIDDRVGQAQVLHNLGAVHRRWKRPPEAERCYRAALALFEEAGDRFGQAFSLSSIGLVAQWQPEGAGYAEECFQRALEVSREFGYRRGEAIALGNLGQLYEREGRLEEAAAHQVDAIELCREIGDTRGEMIELRVLGTVYLGQNRAEAARSVLRRALAIARGLSLPDDEREILSLLGHA